MTIIQRKDNLRFALESQEKAKTKFADHIDLEKCLEVWLRRTRSENIAIGHEKAEFITQNISLVTFLP